MTSARLRKRNESAGGNPKFTQATYFKKYHSNRLLSWDELPAWYRDNEYILSGYRDISSSYRRSLFSAFRVHNETVNIYSHLLGSALFLYLPFPTYMALWPRYNSASVADIIVFSTFFLGISVCFLLSAMYHLFGNHSERIHIFGNQLDYLGIVILMWGSTIPFVYYGFYCSPNLQISYYTLVSILAGFCIYTILDPSFRQSSYRIFRATMYSGLGLSFVVPVIHSIVEFGWETQRRSMSLDWVLVMTVFNFAGAAIYAMRIPEKWYPKRFDIWGSSHQIMHCLVVCAGVALFVGLLRAFDYAHEQRHVCLR